MDRASTSQGSHVMWSFFSLPLKKPARCSLSPLHTNKVAARPLVLTAASVTIHKASLSLGTTICLQSLRADCAVLKA